MQIDPAIARLRHDPAPQQRAQTALERTRTAWRSEPQVAALCVELERYGANSALADCPLLACLVADFDFAHRVVGSLVTLLARQLVEQPLGHVPLRHQYAPGLAVLQLAEASGATLSLLCYEARAAADAGPAQTVCFGGGERHELCLAGTAEARFFEVLREQPDRADLDCQDRLIVRGDALTFTSPHRTRIVDRPLRRMVMLRVSRGDRILAPACEYRIADGALVHRASGDRAESRDEMAAAVLGALGRSDAAPVLAGIARSSASEHLRWRMLCEALALDTAAGFAALTAIAGDVADVLAAPAGALRARLIEGHPSLTALSGPCLA